MARIIQVLAVSATGAYYTEDLAALQARAIPVAERYTADPVTPGFRRVREVAEAVSVGLVLDSGSVAWGDCVAVAYSGKAGRDPVFRIKAGDVGAFLGGSCAETDLSAKVAVHIALATRPEMVMAKPGMGVDEGVIMVQNEMARALAWVGAQAPQS